MIRQLEVPLERGVEHGRGINAAGQAAASRFHEPEVVANVLEWPTVYGQVLEISIRVRRSGMRVRLSEVSLALNVSHGARRHGFPEIVIVTCCEKWHMHPKTVNDLCSVHCGG